MENYKQLPNEALQTSRPKSNKTILIVIFVLFVAAIGYIIYDKYVEPIMSERELAINNSYAAGFNQGMEQWNTFVIQKYNKDKALGYWNNGSYFEINLIKQLCDEQNG